MRAFNNEAKAGVMKLLPVSASKLLLTSLLVFGVWGTASATIVTWQNETVTGVGINFSNQNLFDTAFITFTGFKSDSLTDVSGSGVYHTHSSNQFRTFNLDVRLDGVWTNIFTDSGNLEKTLSSIAGPAIPFSPGVVSGIRLGVSPLTGFAYHLTQIGSVPATNFQFSVVPEPATVLLTGLGLVGLGFAGRRRRLNA